MQRLTDPAESPQVRLEGVRMAAAAMRRWRAAAGRLTPMLSAVLSEKPSEVPSAALRTVVASLSQSAGAPGRPG